MKPYNCKKWWIDQNVVREISVTAESVKEALEKYREIVKERDYIEISQNAIMHADPMFQDRKNGEAVQVGYVITGKTDFEDRERYKWSTQYIDLWVTVLTVNNPFETEENTI